jgi:hypothetical protein
MVFVLHPVQRIRHGSYRFALPQVPTGQSDLENEVVNAGICLDSHFEPGRDELLCLFVIVGLHSVDEGKA